MRLSKEAFMADAAIERLLDQRWLETAADETQPYVQEALRATPRVKDFLNGVWLGHALHPVLTDIPVGAWTAAVAMDAVELASGRTECGPGADAAVAVGLAGAVGAAVSGLADWADTTGRPRRIGMAHALLNVAATVLMAGSYALRRGGQRPAGQALSFAGYGLAFASSWLGGELVFSKQLGVDHTAGIELPLGWVDVMAIDDLPDATLTGHHLDGLPVLVVRRGEHVYAMVDRCAHQGGPLSQGELKGTEVTCPWHGSTFGLDDGRIVRGPSAYCQPVLQCRVREGRVEVRSAEPTHDD
jgi:nitrite reductase/ring-hydroxylating ferredoxin subunit/uncharacterized membrane protein